MGDAILTLNVGSSSLKFSLFEASSERLDRLASGEIETVGGSPRLVARLGERVDLERCWPADARPDQEALLRELIGWAERHLGGRRLEAVAHRIVHGGPDFVEPAFVDADVLARLEALSPMAPLHQPHSLACVRSAANAAPEVAQVACFDTAFHRGHAPEVDRFGLPREWEARGVRRYGFHGLSYEFVAARMRALDPSLADGRLIVAHLGGGASLCAIRAGRSVDTTMGLTPLDGLVMGTRCGAIDPGALLYLQQAHGLAPAALEQMLYAASGLLGVSGLSSDMRDLLASEDPRANEAIELFVFRVVREIGAMTASMGGCEAIVFTAGIGANSPEIRRRICERLAWLGVAIDPVANEGGAQRIEARGARTAVRVIPTDEERMLALHARDLIWGRR